MISRSETLDIPDIEAAQVQQQRIAALGITINQFQKTLQGRAIIERQERFILGGMIYQGYNQKAVECPEDLCSDEEIASTHDIDGSKQRVLDTRRRRFEGNAQAKDKEQAERRRGKIAQERDELQLILMRKQIEAMGPLAPDAPDASSGPDVQPETVTELPMFFCETCQKSFSERGLKIHKSRMRH